MTRRIPIIHALSAPANVFASVVAAFPGAIFLVDGTGTVTHAWASPTAPVRTDGAPGRAIHTLLGLADEHPASGQLQLWLACAIGVDSEMFQLASGDPPRQLPAVVGRGAVDIDYGPVFDATGVTSAVAVFVKAAAHDIDARPAVADAATPEQVERFFMEMQPLLEDCAAELTKLDADCEARQSVHRMFRAMHTIKGAARSAGLGPIADFAHEIETHLAQLRERGHQIGSNELATLRELLRQLSQQILVDAPLDAVVDTMASLYGAYRPAMARAEEAFTAWHSRARDSELAMAFVRVVAQLADLVAPFRMHALSGQIASLLALTDSARSTNRPERRLLAAIDSQLASLHQLIELYQNVYRDVRACDNPTRVMRALAAARGDANAVRTIAATEGLAALTRAYNDASASVHVSYLLEDLSKMFAPAPASLGARASLAAAQRTLTDTATSLRALASDTPELTPIAATIADTAQRLTWMGLDDVIRRARRQASTLATDLGKRVELEAEAFGVVVPESVHRVLHEVLLHAVRNATDHGIESVDERQACCKRATGTIRVAAREFAGTVELEILDDGRGIDAERVRAKAIAAQLIDASAALSEAELLELVFLPGLSTIDHVTSVSGRGVGMDVIRSLVEEHGGSVTLSSRRWQWTRLLVRLPLIDQVKSVRGLDRDDDRSVVRTVDVEDMAVARL